MKKLLLVVLALATALATAPAAKADSFNITLGGTGLTTTSGTLSGDSLGGGLFNINGETGLSINGVSVSNVITVATPGVFSTYAAGPQQIEYDDVLKPASEQIDGYGLLFLLSNGGVFTIFSDGNDYAFGSNVYWNEYYDGAWVNPITGDGGDPAVLTDSPASTPEPSSLLLLGTGLLFMAGFLFWKSKPQASMIQAS